MSSQLKPIKLWGKGGPNPPKIAILLEELELPYEVEDISFPDLKKPEFLAINPNGRMPAIYDPNTDLTLWESGAIIEYLIEKYDTKHKLSFAPGTPESYHAKQWLFFQTTGQGPYYGQAVWFSKFHPEKVPSAVERYTKEINRVTGVVEGHLSGRKTDTSTGGPWLVGDKFSYADLAWIPWQDLTARMMPKEAFNADDFPAVKEWMDKMTSRPAVKKVMDEALKGH
ncbi:glutathione S-transferase [Lindgomyces ingoldianus]|uniref:Glutathione S-transferase n=1 Tax=Lindgomyces ingoldianus TaxID=673940 RepID=A0ACB6REG6_9PLEO|nr:glutathione S-transferase [Lindgomyces ingoldianus]KAF2477673.1 glutathione S-transferase [Lindgomyces ingoldianus]